MTSPTAVKRIKITGCSSPLWWYSNQIGLECDVIGIASDGDYKVIDPADNCDGYVMPADCIVIDPAPAPEANARPTQAINLDSQILDRMRKEYERGRTANSPFPRYHGTFEHFIEEILKDFLNFAWN